MHFNLFGFDLLLKDRLLGFWFFQIGDGDEIRRCLFGTYYAEGSIFIHFLFMNFIIE